MHLHKAMAGILLPAMLCAADPWAGVWKLRVKPDSRIAARTITEIERAPAIFLNTFDDVARTGAKARRQDTLICDGKEHPVPTEKFARTCLQNDAKTRTITDKQDGKIISQIRHALSPDGQVLTATNQITGASTVYDRQ